MDFNSDIFKISNAREFEKFALATFAHQYASCSIYNEFCNSIGRSEANNLSEIPFLPISFFKTHVVSDSSEHELRFKSSGTVGERSRHYVRHASIYKQSFLTTFETNFGKIDETIILALLPNYLEQGESSLVYMVDELIHLSQSPLSGFVLENPTELHSRIERAKIERKKIVLFGVSYALLDLDPELVDLTNVTIIETGGMKGRRKEISKEEFHQILRSRFSTDMICSEYGMTELLSQAYAINGLMFDCPAWMKIMIRDTNDPFSLVESGKTGGINIIDLANFHSCSFIATQDLGRMIGDHFEIIGRFDHSDIRGCNLLIE